MAGSICDACRAIKFEKVFDDCLQGDDVHISNDDILEESKVVGIVLDGDANRLVQASDSDCPLCQLLASTTLCSDEDEILGPRDDEADSKMPYHLKALSFFEHCPWVPLVIGADHRPLIPRDDGVRDCRILLVSHRREELQWSMGPRHYYNESEDGYVACVPKNRRAGLFVPRMVSKTFEHTRAKSWLQNCKSTHATTCNEYCEEILGLKAIDCETMRIVQIESGAPWVALSYVWGQNKKSESSSDDPRPGTFPFGISKTVQDAIAVTKGLEYRYLWVDRHCINQNDETEKRTVIAKMDRIYRGADLTIVAAAGHDEHFGLPGVGTTSRKKQRVVELDSCTILSTGPDPMFETQRSRWWSRGWTFQESLLSRRRLIFTEHQSWFECTQGSWIEALGGTEFLNSPEQRLWVSRKAQRTLHARLPPSYKQPQVRIHMDGSELFSHLLQFASVIREYSVRTLTFDTDSLNAFIGISRYFRDCNPPVADVFGIPFVPSTAMPIDREHAEKYFFYFLSWFHIQGTTPRRREHCPSWTWVGWAGRVDWMMEFDLLHVDEDPFRQMMRHIQFEVDAHVIPEEDYFTVFDSGSSTFPNFGVTLCFEAQLVPSSMFSWDTRVETKAHFQDEHLSNESLTMVKSGSSQGEVSNEESHKLSKSLPANPSDWGTWTVGNNKLWEQSLPPDCDPPEFIAHLDARRRACLLLGDYDGNWGSLHRRFLLVVEWLDEYTARRVGSIVLNSNSPVPVERARLFDNSELSWRYVRII